MRRPSRLSPERARAILRLSMGFSLAELKKARRERARATHPDHNPKLANASALFAEVEAAYEVLLPLADGAPGPDPLRRPGAARQRPGGSGTGAASQPPPPDATRKPAAGRRRPPGPPPAPGVPVAPVVVPLASVRSGGTFEVLLGKRACVACNGQKWVALKYGSGQMRWCPHCRATGSKITGLNAARCTACGSNFAHVPAKCGACDGSGVAQDIDHADVPPDAPEGMLVFGERAYYRVQWGLPPGYHRDGSHLVFRWNPWDVLHPTIVDGHLDLPGLGEDGRPLEIPVDDELLRDGAMRMVYHVGLPYADGSRGALRLETRNRLEVRLTLREAVLDGKMVTLRLPPGCEVPCDTCGGAGCLHCAQSGWRPASSENGVRVAAPVAAGARLRVAVRRQGAECGPTLVVRLATDPAWKWDGQQLSVTWKVAMPKPGAMVRTVSGPGLAGRLTVATREPLTDGMVLNVPREGALRPDGTRGVLKVTVRLK